MLNFYASTSGKSQAAPMWQCLMDNSWDLEIFKMSLLKSIEVIIYDHFNT